MTRRCWEVRLGAARPDRPKLAQSWLSTWSGAGSCPRRRVTTQPCSRWPRGKHGSTDTSSRCFSASAAPLASTAHLRHTAAVHRVVAWYRTNTCRRSSQPTWGVDIKSTQRYPRMPPELLQQASQRCSQFAGALSSTTLVKLACQCPGPGCRISLPSACTNCCLGMATRSRHFKRDQPYAKNGLAGGAVAGLQLPTNSPPTWRPARYR